MPRPLLAQEVEIDVGERRPAARRESVRSRRAARRSRKPRPGRPRRGRSSTPLPRRRIEIGGQAAGGLRLAEKPPRLGLADRDVAGGEVGEHRGAGERRLGAGRDRHPEVLADLGVHDEAGTSSAANRRSGPKGASCPARSRPCRPRRRRRRRSAGARRIRGSSAGGPSARRRAAGRGARRARSCRGGRDAGSARRRGGAASARGTPPTMSADAALDRLEQRVLQQEVVDRVGR